MRLNEENVHEHPELVTTISSSTTTATECDYVPARTSLSDASLLGPDDFCEIDVEIDEDRCLSLEQMLAMEEQEGPKEEFVLSAKAYTKEECRCPENYFCYKPKGIVGLGSLLKHGENTHKKMSALSSSGLVAHCSVHEGEGLRSHVSIRNHEEKYSVRDIKGEPIGLTCIFVLSKDEKAAKNKKKECEGEE